MHPPTDDLLQKVLKVVQKQLTEVMRPLEQDVNDLQSWIAYLAVLFLQLTIQKFVADLHIGIALPSSKTRKYLTIQ